MRKILFILFIICGFAKNILSQNTTYLDTIDNKIYQNVLFSQQKKESNEEFSKRIEQYNENDIRVGRLNILSKKIPNSICRFNSTYFLQIQSLTKKMGSGVSSLINLRECDFYLDNLRMIPKYFGDLKKMERIHLLSNIKRLPQNFFELQNLYYLELCAKRMKIVSTDYEKLQNLEFLSLDGNIQRIDIHFEKLQKLRDLEIYDYKGKIIPGYRERPKRISNDTVFTFFPDKLEDLYLEIENVEDVPIEIFYSKSLSSIWLHNCYKLKSFIDLPINIKDTLTKIQTKKELIYLDLFNCNQLEDIEALSNFKIRNLSILGLNPKHFKNVLSTLSRIESLNEVTFSYASFVNYKIPQELVDFALRHEFCRIIIEPEDEGGVENEKIDKVINAKFHENINNIKELANFKNIEVKYSKYDN